MSVSKGKGFYATHLSGIQNPRLNVRFPYFAEKVGITRVSLPLMYTVFETVNTIFILLVHNAA